jgi:hypothetical protein
MHELVDIATALQNATPTAPSFQYIGNASRETDGSILDGRTEMVAEKVEAAFDPADEESCICCTCSGLEVALSGGKASVQFVVRNREHSGR